MNLLIYTVLVSPRVQGDVSKCPFFLRSQNIHLQCCEILKVQILAFQKLESVFLKI